MAFIRPIVFVEQQFSTVTVAPDTPDLNCCLVGPAYHIQDYPDDKLDIYAGEFVKTGETANAACLADGSSGGQPDPGSTFVVLADPPNHISGGVLDSSSVDLIMDDLYIDLNHSDDGGDGGNPLVADDNTFTAANGDFVNKKVVPGDRLIMTNGAHAGDDDYTIVKLVKSVESATVIKTTSTFKTAEVDNAVGGVDTTGVLWRVEHQLDDEHLDESLYATIVGNEITIKTGPTGILVTYESTTWAVNYGKLYVGYRELRTDLDSVTEISSSSGIETAIGRNDERNPLAAGAHVTFANTGTPIQVFGVVSDDAAGHTAAQDKMSTRSDVYAIVPMTDPSQGVSGSSWVSVIASWNTNCLQLDDPDKGKFRVVLGSYDTLPTEKTSAPASVVGHTEDDPNEAGHSVFVDPAIAAEFVTNGVSSSHLLDVTHNTNADLLTCANQKHLFSSSGYNGAKELLGAIGEKRARVALADTFATERGPEPVSYLMRSPILSSEGATASAVYANTTGATWGTDGGGTPKGRITKTGEFSNVAVGDVAHVSNGATGTHNDGFYVFNVDLSGNYIDVELTEVTGDTVDVQVYRPAASSNLGTLTATTRTVTGAGASDFANVAVGDLCVILQSTAAANVGMWVVENKLDSQNVVIGDPETDLVDELVGATNVVFFRTVASAPDTDIYVRARLTRLRDNTANFTTTVSTGELIEIPYPADTDPTKWDTPTTSWPIDDVVSDEVLDASLEALEELGPELFIAGFDGDMAYRIAITLNKPKQVTELGTIPESIKSHRCVMVWPNEVLVSSLENELTGVQSRQTGQYLACTIGGMVAGLPSHQGFTYIGVGGIQQIFNSNFYFTDAQLTDMRDDGWYVFVQDSESSLPYSIHEVTTNVSSYEFGEFMNVKNFDYIALYMKEILEGFLGEYNITPETLAAISGSVNAGAEYLMLRKFPKIGAPLLGAELTLAQQSEVDQVDVYLEIDMPKVLNKIGLYLKTIA